MISSTPAVLSDLRPFQPWRRAVPSWLRSLIWQDSAESYDAFLSYSWKSDSQIAPVIQSVIQRFLCPWYKLRAKNVFRDLSCLPAGSNLETELFDRLDRSLHFVVLASPESATSHGMEIEARHWFSRPRKGQVLIIVSSGHCKDWAEIRDHLVPAAVRDNLTSEPLWISLAARREKILANPKDSHLREQLIEDLKQALLRFYPNRDWGQLRGEERSQRRRALGLLLSVSFLLLVLTVSALLSRREAIHERDLAEQRRKQSLARELMTQSLSLADREYDSAVLLAVEAARIAPAVESQTHLQSLLNRDPEFIRVVRLHPASVLALLASQRGDSLASVDEEGRVITSGTTGGAVRERALRLSEKAEAAAFAPDGTRLALAVGQNIEIWSIAEERRLRVLQGHTGSVTSVCFSPDGKLLASGSWDNTAIVWNVDEGRPVYPALTGHSKSSNPLSLAEGVLGVAFSPRGTLLATTGGDNTLILWDAATGRRKAGPLRGHGIREGQLFPGVRAVVFSPDEKIVATGGDDRDIRLWDAVSGQALGEPMHGHNGALRALLFIDDGQGLVSSDEFGDTRVWSVQDRRPLKILRGYAGRINGLAAVGSHAVLSYGENGKIIQWDPFAWPDRLAVTLVHPSPDARPRVVGATDRRHFPDLLWSVAFSPSGRRLASGADDGAVVVWELSTNQEIARFECQPGQVFALKFSPDESSIACGGLGDVVHIRDLSSGGDTILTGGHPAGSIDFSPDGESVAIGYLDGAIRGFKAHGGAPLFEFQTGGSPVVLVAFVDSGQQLLAVTSKGHVVMWNVGSGKALRESELHNSEPSVALEQDTLAFWMTDRVQLWSVSKWSPIGSVQAPIADRAPHPFHLAVSGSRLAVAQGSMASVWDTRMRSLAWPILDARGSINAVVFDPKGGRIAVVGASAVVSMWSLEWAAWTGLACKVAGHSLSRDDWQRWLGDEPYQRSCESQRRQ